MENPEGDVTISVLRTTLDAFLSEHGTDRERIYVRRAVDELAQTKPDGVALTAGEFMAVIKRALELGEKRAIQ